MSIIINFAFRVNTFDHKNEKDRECIRNFEKEFNSMASALIEKHLISQLYKFNFTGEEGEIYEGPEDQEIKLFN